MNCFPLCAACTVCTVIINFSVHFFRVLLEVCRKSFFIILILLINNSDYLQKARKYGHFTGYKN